MPVAWAIPLIHGGVPPPKSKLYSQAIQRGRGDGEALHLVEQPAQAGAVAARLPACTLRRSGWPS